MEPVKVSAARKKITVDLPSIEGGQVTFNRSLTVEDQMAIETTTQAAEDDKSRFTSGLSVLVKCFHEWNLVDDAGAPIPFTPEMIGKTCTLVDIMLMLQTVSGKQLVSDDGLRVLSLEEVAKKGLSA